LIVIEWMARENVGKKERLSFIRSVVDIHSTFFWKIL
jgi:hypothetical protein